MLAGRECYGTFGLRHTTIPQLCSVAGVTARHFYELFETQDALLRAVYDEVCAELLAAISPEMTAASSLATRMQRGSRAYFTFVTSDPRIARIFALEWIDVGHAVDRREQAIREIFTAESLASDGIEDAIDIEMLAISLVGIAKALTADWFMSDRKKTVDQMADHLTKIWSRTLRLDAAAG